LHFRGKESQRKGTDQDRQKYINDRTGIG